MLLGNLSFIARGECPCRRENFCRRPVAPYRASAHRPPRIALAAEPTALPAAACFRWLPPTAADSLDRGRWSQPPQGTAERLAEAAGPPRDQIPPKPL